jgi:transketolase
LSLRPTFARTITELSESDPRLVTIVGDISHGIFKDLRNSQPSRYFNIGICEPGMLGIASGLSAKGLIPVVHTITPFLIERSFEQIKLDFGYQKLGVNLVSVGGAFDYSKLGCTHHSYSDYALLSQIDSCNIFFPGSDNEFETLFRKNYTNEAINYYRLTEFPHQIEISRAKIETGKPIRIAYGRDVTLIAVGSSLKQAFHSLEFLNSRDISVDLIYLHTLKPLDTEMILDSLVETKKLVVVSQTYRRGGISQEILSAIPRSLPFIFESLEINDFLREYGTYDFLLRESGLDVEQITSKVLALF